MMNKKITFNLQSRRKDLGDGLWDARDPRLRCLTRCTASCYFVLETSAISGYKLFLEIDRAITQLCILYQQENPIRLRFPTTEVLQEVCME